MRDFLKDAQVIIMPNGGDAIAGHFTKVESTIKGSGLCALVIDPQVADFGSFAAVTGKLERTLQSLGSQTSPADLAILNLRAKTGIKARW